MAIGKSLQYSTFSSISCYNGFKILSSSTPGTGICCRKEVYRASQRFPIPVCIHLFCLFSTFIKEYYVWQLRQLKDRDISQVGPSKRGGSSPFTSRFFIKRPPEPHEPWTSCSSFWEPKASLARVPAQSGPLPAHHRGSTCRQW